MENQKNQGIPASDGFQLLKKPETYRIEVVGVVDPDWSERLGGLHIESRTEDDSKEPVTLLEGLITDQAQLFGVLNTLCNLRYKLLSVKKISKEELNNGIT